MYAPYYDTCLAPNTASIASTAQSSGAKYFTLAFLQSTSATTALNFAQANGMSMHSIFAIRGHNGGCPGTVGSNTCSGVTQNAWDFSHLLEPFTS